MPTETVKYQGQYLKLTEVEIDNRTWEKVYLTPGVIIYPITDQKKIILIKEKRPHEDPPFRLKFVTGLMDDKKQDALYTANRELQEEIGYKAENLEILIHRKTTGTVNNEVFQIMATNLIKSKIPNPDGEDTIMEIVEYSIDEILELLKEEKLPWDHAMLGIFKIKYDSLLG